MLKTLLYLVANVLVVLGLSAIIEGFEVSNFVSAAIFLLVLTFLNWTVVPVLKLLTLPINLLSLGLVGLFINIMSIWLATALVPGMELFGSLVSKIFTLILVSIGLSLGHMLINSFLKEDNQDS